MTREEAKKIIEALLFVSGRPLSLDKIVQALEEFDAACVRSIIKEIGEEYNKTNRSFSITEVGGGFQILTDPFYAPWIKKLFQKEKRHKLTMPSLETMAIIAYRQPVTKADIEAIRGVNIDGVIESLLERGLIRVSGRKDVIGRPFLYSVTKEFLIHFGLKSLQDLPRLHEFTEDDIQLGRDELIKKESEVIEREDKESVKTKEETEDKRDEKRVQNVTEVAREDR